MNTPEIQEAIFQAITESYFQSESIKTRTYINTFEYELEGSPFHCSGVDFIKTRRMVCRILVSIQIVYRSRQ